MPVTRVCVYHVDNVAAGKSRAIAGEVLACMMYEFVVHQVTVLGVDANKIAYQKAGQLNASYSISTFKFRLDRMENTLKNKLKIARDMNVRQFHAISFYDLR